MISLLEPIIEVDTGEVQEKYCKEYTREGYYLKNKLNREVKLIEDLKNANEEKQNISGQISILI